MILQTQPDPNFPPRVPGERAGRDREAGALAEWLASPASQVISIVGVRGAGKTLLVHEVTRAVPFPVVHFRATPDQEGALRRALAEESTAVLGPLPPVERPELLPTGDPGVDWVRLLDSILEGFRRRGGGILVLDGLEALNRARRRLGAEVHEAWRRATAFGLPLHLVLVARSNEALRDWPIEPPTAARVELGSLPYRVAGWMHGPSDAREAFQFWAVFGDHPAHLGGLRPGEGLEAAVLRRVLHPEGDLHRRILDQLEATFQAPHRYLAVLRTLASGDRSWGELARLTGEESGNRLAPYLQRLAEEGWVRVRRPLGSSSRSRDRRYGLVDPFVGFWLNTVLPRQSALLRLGPEEFWASEVRPRLQPHLDRWLAELARRWLLEHGLEGWGSEAREAGALWGADTPEMEVAARMANGMVIYGAVQPGGSEGEEERLTQLQQQIGLTRYGLGRQHRVALLVLQAAPGVELERGIARDPMARWVGLPQLMGETGGSSTLRKG